MADDLTDPAILAPDQARRDAEEAWNLVGSEVERAHRMATDVLASSDDPWARSTAARALGLAAAELTGADACLREMQQAFEEARRLDDAALLALAEIGLAIAHQYLGDQRATRKYAERAVRRAPEQPRVLLSHGVILERLGEPTRALDRYDRAEALSRASGDLQALARALCNRGVLRTYLADLEAARADLEAAHEVCVEAGIAYMATATQANLGYLAVRRGDVLEALRRLDAASPPVRALGGMRLGYHELDRCEALMGAGLAADAADAARAAVSAFAAVGLRVEAAEAQTAVAQAALGAGEIGLALEAAESARRTLASAGSPWGALAEEVVVRARWAEGWRDARLSQRAARVADALDAAGWRSSSASARVLAARIDLALGRRAQAARQLEMVRDTTRSPVGLRVQARCAAALLRREGGDRRGARAALRSGWELLERYRATLGATELRAGATAHVAELVAIGLEMAIEDRRPREVLGWAERGRAGALTPRATAPPHDPELAALLGELRVVAAEADAAAKRGEDSATLLRRQAAVEQRVRNRARLLPADEAGPRTFELDPAQLLANLEERALIEYVVSDGELWAVIGAAGRFSLRRICTVPLVRDEADGLRVALRRLAFGSPVPQLRQAARDGADYARRRLAQLLFDPIADLIGDRERVIVPMGILHAVPWGALHEPGQRHVVAPSAVLWSRAAGAAPRTLSTLLVAGPRLAEAETEIADITALDPTRDVRILTGDGATVDAVRESMAGASLAHLACHGHFRADNALFSSLELHDGALSVYELERLGQAPQRIILSACDAGLSAVHPGDELLGLAAALLRLGTTGLVASVLPVPDGATRHLMVALHEELAAGADLTGALAAARGRMDPDRDDELVAGWAFQVLGAG